MKKIISLVLITIMLLSLSAFALEVENNECVKDAKWLIDKNDDGFFEVDLTKKSNSIKYNFKLFNELSDKQNVKVIMGIYYDNVLSGVKAISKSVESKKTTDNLTIGFDNLPDGTKENISVKVFVFFDGKTPVFTDKAEVLVSNNRNVAFGEDVNFKTVVAFMGDSITHINPSYLKWIEYYYRIKYPTKDIKFVNKGISGDSAAGNEARFYWDILNDPNTGRTTEACLMIGMNDVNRRLYANDEKGNDVGTEEAKQGAIDYCLTNISDISDLCEKEGVKLTLITPPVYDETEYTSTENMDGTNEALGKIAEGIIKIANERNLPYIDFYGSLNKYNDKIRSMDGFKKSATFNTPDRIHATDVGAFAEGFIFISQQLKNILIAGTEIDVNNLSVDTDSAEVTDVTYKNDVLTYIYAPKSLPMYVTDEYKTMEQKYGIPVTESINREIIKVSGLRDGNYKLMIGDAELGIYSSEDLEKGVNIATNPENPGYIQSEAVYNLVTKKMGYDASLRNIAYVERNLVKSVDLKDVGACIVYLKANYADSTDTRYIAYPDNKKAQKETVKNIKELEKEMVEKAKPGVYTVKIIKQ